MNIALLVIGALLLIPAVSLSVLSLRPFVKRVRYERFSAKELYFLLGSAISFLFSGGLLGAGIIYSLSPSALGGDAAMAVSGLSLFFLFFPALWCAFYLRWWRKDADEATMKLVKIALYGSIPFAVLTFFLFTEGIAPYLEYPLASGFVISSSGLQLVRAGESIPSGLHISWYGIIIIGGALVSYFVSDHRFYGKYGKHGMLDGTLVVGFICGVIGARVWYVVGNWNGDGAGGPNFSEAIADGRWYEIFQIWNGGLTIIGGAVAGIIAGTLFVHFTKKEVDIRWGLDAIVPTILLAQAIGRWGNFFNCEVYGAEVSAGSLSFLPSIIVNQLGYNNAGLALDPGRAFVPLFLIESVINIAGYFIIAYLVPFLWRKYRPKGALCGLYMVWYGIVRMIMEPLRDPSFNMGADGNWSFWNSLGYILIGLAFIGIMYLLDYLGKRKKKEEVKPQIEGETAQKQAEGQKEGD